MKKFCTVLLVFWVAACNTTLSPSSPAGLETTQAHPSPLPTPLVLSTSPSTPISVFPPTLIIPTLQPGSPVELLYTIAPSLHMIDARVGWAVQHKYPSELRPGYQPEISYPWQLEGYILRTTNGGKTWQDVTPPNGAYATGGFFALDVNRAWASESIPCCTNITASRVWRTADGGRTWQTGQPFTITAAGVQFFMPRKMQFIDANTGWLVATVQQDGLTENESPTLDHNLLFRTTDGGETWEEINSTSEDLGAGFGVVAFIDSSTGWYSVQSGGRDTFSGYFAEGGWKIRHTIDGGDSFSLDTMIPLPPDLQKLESSNPVMNCSDHAVIAFTPQIVGMDWGCEISSAGPWYSYFSVTTDAGNTWTTWKAEGSEYFFDARLGWRVISPPLPGQLGRLQQTTDGGASWVTIKTVSWEYAGFDFISEQEGWGIVFAGGQEALLHTRDGGRTWEDLKPVITSP